MSESTPSSLSTFADLVAPPPARRDSSVDVDVSTIHNGELSRRSNRKLIFQLVNELLADILKPHLDSKPWVESNGNEFGQLSLCDEFCHEIWVFPAADCRVLEDIDSLIDTDLGKSKLNGSFEEEEEGLVCEIEGELMECLVRETLAVVVGGGFLRWLTVVTRLRRKVSGGGKAAVTAVMERRKGWR
ncbi:hypothetical protein CASFOL_009498 [Castilleja foliolosa]|uniref:DUF4378 domain-containing protein n=1 Tax=Castilleja foliolosa TaxID=1961234 RepID=A0ABD3E1G0_9LAMI